MYDPLAGVEAAIQELIDTWEHEDVPDADVFVEEWAHKMRAAVDHEASKNFVRTGVCGFCGAKENE